MPGIKSWFWVASALLGFAPLPLAYADLPGKHPLYLDALTALRTARSLIEHRLGETAAYGDEDVAIQQIDAAIAEVTAAAIDDGRDIHAHPAAGLVRDRLDRLQKAIELLERAHADIYREEDDLFARGLKHRSLERVEWARRQTEHALYEAEHRV